MSTILSVLRKDYVYENDMVLLKLNAIQKKGLGVIVHSYSLIVYKCIGETERICVYVF